MAASLLFVLYLTMTQVILARMSGGGFGVGPVRDYLSTAHGKKWGSFFGRAPEIIFALPFGIAANLLWPEIPFAWLLGWVVSYFFMEIGHGNFFHDGVSPIGHVRGDGVVAVDRPGSLETWSGLHWILPAFGIAPRSKWYCRIMMGLKWFLIMSPLGWYALAGLIIGPVSYAISFRYRPINHPEFAGTGFAEMITGLSGLVVGIAIILA